MKQDMKTRYSTAKKPDANVASGFFVANKQQISCAFGLAVKARREAMGITQTDLAKVAKLNRSYLSQLERGLTNISLERANKIAQALNCNLCDLLERRV